MNRAGELVGYSDFDVMNRVDSRTTAQFARRVLGVDQPDTGVADQLSGKLPSPYGYGDAYAINDSNQIVGASMTASSQSVGVLWQLNHNTNGASSTTNAPFWEITDLNNRLTDPSWQVFQCDGHQQ